MSISNIHHPFPPFKLGRSPYEMNVLKLIDPMSSVFFTQLTQKLEEEAESFKNSPIILDLEDFPVNAVGFTFHHFIRRLQKLHLIPVGVRGGTEHQKSWAHAAGLAIFTSGRMSSLEPHSKPEKKDKTEVVHLYKHRPTLIEEHTIRSGRQIYAENSNLVLLSSVRPGGEVLADGDIHIYGRLEGRALAGCRKSKDAEYGRNKDAECDGNKDARIFCQVMAAEMLSIAGQYITHENIERRYKHFKDKATCIFLKDGEICMNELTY